MLINLKVKTLDAQTHEFSIDNEVSINAIYKDFSLLCIIKDFPY